MEPKTTNRLLGALKQLAESGTDADFSFDLDIDSLPAGEREPALMLKRLAARCKAASEQAVIMNRVALVLLAGEEKAFNRAMSEGLALIAGIADIDRMSVFRNTEKPDGLYLSQMFRWRNDSGGTVSGWNELIDVPYSQIAPRFEAILAAGRHIGGHVDHLPGSEIFKRYGCETILVIPVFDDGQYWGATLFERLNHNTFTGREIDALRSASFMLANAVIRNEKANAVRQTTEQAQLMLDTAPIAVTMWDKNFRVIDCSRTALDVFGYSSKQELIENFVENAPEFQPCGRRSLEILAEAATEAFQKGICRLEWTDRDAGGEPIIFEDTAVRVKYKDEYALMLYSRDIREEKKMLAAQAHWYKSLLDGVPFPISVTDPDMKLIFTNVAAEKLFGRSREELIGRPCSLWNCPICNTEECSVARAKRGQKQSFFKNGGLSFRVDTEIIRGIKGEMTGYLEILHDITEVENLARRQAEAANEAKSAFLAQMSHEMRTPLSAVIGLSELVLENGGLSQDNEIYLDKIYNAGSTLLSIVNDILDISKIEAGKFEIIPLDYDVPSLINDTITQNILRIHSKPVRFSLNIGENVPVRLRGDDVRVKQILSNLLSNAFKYTDEGTVELRIDYERDGDAVWTTFRVSDTGVGIKPEDISRLFTDYSRFDGETNRKIGGTGLGLSITKRLVELMGGSISATSEYGKGSVFTAKIRQQYVSGSVIGSEMAEHLRGFQYTTSKRRSGSQLHRVRIPYARVLVVDDNKTNLDIAQGLMRPYGMEIDCVTSGQAAIDAIRGGKYKYRAVFMDHMMPGMDGVEAVRIIREEIGSEYAKTVPIIALTANALAGNMERFISQGFNAFVSKPIDIFRLDSVIRRWVWDKDRDGGQEEPRVFAERRKRPDRRKGGDRRKGERRNSAAVPEFVEVIDGLDWMKGIERFGGADSFRQILRSFAVNTRTLLDSVSEPDAESLPQYAITVHGIKSSSRSIGAAAIGSMAESLEFAAKDGNLDFVNQHNQDFLANVRRLIADIHALLDKKPDAMPRKDRPEDTELERLRSACEGYNMDEIEAVMRDIEGYEYTADDGLALWLRDNIAQLNYAQVIDKISEATRENRYERHQKKNYDCR